MSIESQLTEYAEKQLCKVELYVRPEVDPLTREEVKGTVVYVAVLHEWQAGGGTAQGASREGFGEALKNAALDLTKKKRRHPV